MQTHWWPKHEESSTPERVGTLELRGEIEGDLEIHGDRSFLV